MSTAHPSRRELLKHAVAILVLMQGRSRAARAQGHEHTSSADRIADIEKRLGGRVGIAALNTGTGRRIAHRADERFPMCSTFKWLLAAQVLARVDAGSEHLDRWIPYGPAELLEYAPITRQHVSEGGMRVSDLCAAAVAYSDNTAGNLLLATVGGPAGFTRLVRSLGDRATRLDRTEPDLNSALPDDPRDTTTPSAMIANLEKVLLRTRILREASRRRLHHWLVGNTTGDAKLRAGLPAGWEVGDKTGMGANGSTNDVAIVTPPGKAPLLIAAYAVGSTASADDRNAALAEVGRIVAESL